MGRKVGDLTLLRHIALPLDMETYSFDVEQIAFTCHNDQGRDFNVHLDPTMGVTSASPGRECPSKRSPSGVGLGSRQQQMEVASGGRQHALAGKV